LAQAGILTVTLLNINTFYFEDFWVFGLAHHLLLKKKQKKAERRRELSDLEKVCCSSFSRNLYKL
jgi:hypothetical protein